MVESKRTDYRLLAQVDWRLFSMSKFERALQEIAQKFTMTFEKHTRQHSDDIEYRLFFRNQKVGTLIINPQTGYSYSFEFRQIIYLHRELGVSFQDVILEINETFINLFGMKMPEKSDPLFLWFKYREFLHNGITEKGIANITGYCEGWVREEHRRWKAANKRLPSENT